jgi:hypothetical protein
LNVFNFFPGFDISFQEMAFAFQSPRHIDGIRAAFDGPQHVYDIHPTAARHLNDFHVGRITQTHGTGQISSRISAILAAERDDLGSKTFTHLGFLSLLRNLTLNHLIMPGNE